RFRGHGFVAGKSLNFRNNTKRPSSLEFRVIRIGRSLRGTRIAKGAITMNNTVDTTTNIGQEPTLTSDWVEAHADYLFNFAIGQVRDTHVAEDLVQETFLAAVKSQNSFAGQSTRS